MPNNAETFNVYRKGILDVKTTEFLELVVSAALRCAYGIKYLLKHPMEQGASKEEVVEALGIAILTNGTIVVPHLSRVHEYWEELEAINT